MFQTRSLSTVLVASLGLAAGLAFAVPQTVRAAGTPCTGDLSNPAVAKIKEACAKGGKEEAKNVMKDLSKKAGLKCESCHKDGGPKYETKDNAIDDFKNKLNK